MTKPTQEQLEEIGRVIDEVGAVYQVFPRRQAARKIVDALLERGVLVTSAEVDAAVAAALERAAQVVLMDSCDKSECDIPAHQKAQERAAQIRGLITPAQRAALTEALRQARLEEAAKIAGMECRRCLGGDSPTSLDFDNFFHTDGTLCEAQWANERLAALSLRLPHIKELRDREIAEARLEEALKEAYLWHDGNSGASKMGCDQLSAGENPKTCNGCKRIVQLKERLAALREPAVARQDVP